MRYTSVRQFVAIKPLHFSKVEAKIQSGIATIAQKRDIVQIELVMDFEYEGKLYYAGRDKVILHGDAGLQAWNRLALSLDGNEFVLCPIANVLGFAVPSASSTWQYKYPAPPTAVPMPIGGGTLPTNGNLIINGISYEGLK